MKTVALISGGKDSCYNMMQCVAEGHDIVALANLRPKHKDEMDSYMYQTVGHHAIDLYAEAMGLPLFRRTIEGDSVETGKDYSVNAADEVEDLYELLKEIQMDLDIEAVSVGAILSDYQRVRVENVCSRLGLTVLAYLWRRDQEELLTEMIDSGVVAILIKVAALGLKPTPHLGKTLAEIQPHMEKMKLQFGLNVCGEGGEYETFTLDCPLFNKNIVIDEKEVVLHSDDAFAPVAYLNLKKMHLEEKTDLAVSLPARLEGLPMKRSRDLEEELQSLQLSDVIIKRQDSPPSSQSVAQSPSTLAAHAKGDALTVCMDSSGFFSVSGLTAEWITDVDLETTMSSSLERLKETLHEHTLEMCDISAVYLYVRSMKDFSRINGIYKKYFDLNPPVRVCVEVSFPTNILAQIDVIGYRKSGTLPQHCMHVQGLSHWAPANIGPYSQATKVGDLICVAGQIGMVPADLRLVGGGVSCQCCLSLRHVERVLAAMTSGAGMSNILLSVCYVTDRAFIQPARLQWEKVTAPTASPDGQASLVTFVIVPELPKSACVEWQVYSSTAEARTGGDLRRHGDHCICTAKYLLALGNPTVCSMLVSIAQESGSSPDAESAISPALGVVADIWKLAETRTQQLIDDQLSTAGDEEQWDSHCLKTTLRIFYHQDMFHMDELLKAYKAVVQERFGGNVPAATCIPVRGFQSDDTCITLCT